MVNTKKKPAGRKKAPCTEVLDLTNLSQEWDSQDEIRDRLRKGEGLLVEGKGEDIPSVLAVLPVLQPFITRMSLTTTRPLPPVETLREEVETIYLRNQRVLNGENAPDVVGISWRIRKLLAFTKMKARRGEVSHVPHLHYTLYVHRIHALANHSYLYSLSIPHKKT